jgi:uncharacterized protein YutE (UPF0331/DUF86 family)
MRHQIIRSKLSEINESINLVLENLPDTYEEFSNMGLIKDGIYKRVEYALENVFDICSIINSDLKLGIPINEGGVLNNLDESDIFSEEMILNLKSMRGFRNILVHRYGKIDDQVAYKNIKLHIDDFDSFIEEVENLF